MGTSDVRLDPSLNEAVWNRGVKNVPRRIRVRLAKRRSEDEEASEKEYTLVSFVPVTSFKGTWKDTSYIDANIFCRSADSGVGSLNVNNEPLHQISTLLFHDTRIDFI